MTRIPQKLNYPFTCPKCRHPYDQDITLTCPHCGTSHHRCPDITCGNDLTHPKSCEACYKLKYTPPLPPTPKKAAWGGRRAGAGAPKGSMNHLINGSRSALIHRAIDLLTDHPELRPILMLLSRLVTDGTIPQTTRRLLLKALEKGQCPLWTDV
jgi:hypothetical protein